MSETKKPSRRDFLKKSSVVVAGAAMAGGLSLARTRPRRRAATKSRSP